MSHLLKDTIKIAVGTCITLSVVSIAATVVAGSSISRIVSSEYKNFKNIHTA